MRPLRKIGILLAIVFFLPAFFFSIYEFSTLTRDEKMMEDIFTKQLEALLFSINQYSDDIVNSWVLKIEPGLGKTPDVYDYPLEIKKLLQLNPSIHTVFTIDTIDQHLSYRLFSLTDSTDMRERINRIALGQKKKISQLVDYKKNGFQKIESLYDSLDGNNQKGLFFVTGSGDLLRLSGVIIDPDDFIQDVIGPRLQLIAKDQFILSVFRKGSSNPVYSTLARDNAVLKTEAFTKNLWLFPDYTLGIRTKGKSLQSLIDQRTTTNVTLLIMMDIILIVAVVLVFRNVKREVQLAQNKSDFVSNVSHEIRTPLALISLFAETLEMGRVKSEEKKKEYYSIIHKEAMRLSGIVNNILNFSQTEAKKKKLITTTVEMSEQVKDILNTYDFHLKNKGFNYSIDGANKVWIQADKEAFAEVLINLIDNAVKYSTNNKLIEITVGKENEFGFVAVKDHGIGISKVDQKHIFDKFHRVSSGNLAKIAGTGLGLSLVKQLIEMQNGKVIVHSELGKGATFITYFPLDFNHP